MLINFAYSPKIINKPPGDLPESVHKIMWRRLNGTFINKRGHPETLARLIQKGHAYTSCHLHYRHQRNFIQGQVLSLDFDEHGGFDELLNNDFINKYAYFIYSTPSSTQENPRSRVVFVLPESIKSSNTFSLMARALVRKYNQADGSCKDPARLFYGSKNCDVLFLNNLLPLKIIGQMALDVDRQDKEEEKKNKQQLINFASLNGITDETLNRNLQHHLDKIRTAPPGQKNHTRISVARLIGGYVSGGYISQGDAISCLIDAALSNTSKPQLAESDVIAGFQYGLQAPVKINPVTFADWGVSIFPEE